MLKQTVKYVDFNNNPQTEDLYFHLSKSEVISLHSSGFGELLRKLTLPGANKEDLIETFKKVIGMAYGTKSENGRRFHKDAEKTADFLGSPAYDAFFMDLITGDPAGVIKFIQGILPDDLALEASALARSQTTIDIPDPTSNSVVPSITDVKLPVPKEKAQDDVPAAFAKKTGPKTLDQMSEEELRAELAAIRANRSE